MAPDWATGNLSKLAFVTFYRPPVSPTASQFSKEQWFLLAKPSSGCEVRLGLGRGTDVDSVRARAHINTYHAHVCLCIYEYTYIYLPTAHYV